MEYVPRQGALGGSLPYYLSFDWHLPTTPHEGFLMSTGEEYLEQKSYALGNRRYELLEHGPSQRRQHDFRVVTRKQLEVVAPDWAKHLVPRQNTVTQVEAWRPPTSDGTRVLDIKVDIKGVPVKVWGTGTLAPVGNIGHRLDIVMTVVSPMPVVGGRIAAFVSSQVETHMQGEGDFAVQWVDTHEEWRPH